MTAPSIRLHVFGTLHGGGTVTLNERQTHYLGHVMRLAPGADILLFNGADGEWRGRLAFERRVATAALLAQTRAQAAEPDCWLCFALLKRQKTDLVVEKATELGVSVIQPVITARTQADHVNLERLRAIATEAAEQCERLTVPEIRPPVALPALLAGWDRARRLLLADERRTAATPRAAHGPSALLIGPEGGFPLVELDAVAALPFVTRVSLGRRILRAETAAIAGLVLLLAPDPQE